MPAHKHHKLIMEYAKLAQEYERPWEFMQYKHRDTWFDFMFHPRWDADSDYRLKPPQPKFILINNIEVPEPLREAPKGGTIVYKVDIDEHGLIDYIIWKGIKRHLFHLDCGLLHLTEDAARQHWEAIISGSKKG
jgi:hypothetical protein